MLDKFNRKINYLRVSITDRCNLRCAYCMPETGVKLIPRESILSFEEIVDITQTAARMGINKVRITGGEPLVRNGVVGLVSLLSKIKQIEDLSMTTNGTLLENFAQPLAEAGLHRINISLDTLDPLRYAKLTRGGDLNRVLSGIHAAKATGFNCIKLNCVIEESCEEPDARSVSAFAKENNLQVRFIRRMNLSRGEFWTVQSATGGDCTQCNRLRLSSDGMIRPCLFNDLAYNVRSLGIEKALRLAIEHKPQSGQNSKQNEFYTIGG